MFITVDCAQIKNRMYRLIILLVFVLISCSTLKKVKEEGREGVSKLVFYHYSEITEKGEQNSDMLMDSLISNIMKEGDIDSVGLEILDQFRISEMYKSTPKNNICIEVKNDTIWKYTTQNDIMIGDYIRIDAKEGSLYYHAKRDRSINYRKVNLYESNRKYSYEEYINDKKDILGYECFKIVIRVKENSEEESPFKFGDTIYEMYVTNEIDLPIQALLNIGKKYSNIFPLEVRTWEENLSGICMVYKIMEIE